MRTVAHISDVHFGKVDPPVADRLVEELNARQPSLLVISGDLTQRARPEQFRAAREFLDRLPGPQLVVPGNHDIPLWNVFRRFFSPLGAYRRIITPDLFPVFEDEELLVMGINTARPFTWSLDGFWKDGRIASEQLARVKEVARRAGRDVFRILVTHHPFIPPPGERMHGIVRGAMRALAGMEADGIEMCLAGHLHMGYSGDVRTHFEAVGRTILSVQAGTATSTRRRGEPNAYNWITLDGHHVTIAVHTFEHDAFVLDSETEYNRRNERWELLRQSRREKPVAVSGN